MLNRIQHEFNSYPRQFWLMFFGMIISTLGASMIWPFLTIYVSEKLSLSLTQVGVLLTMNAAAGLISSVIAGPVTDFAGRKWVMVASLVVNGLTYFMLSRADSLTSFAILMIISGASNPLYRVGSDAMLADLVLPDRRPDAYALLRMANNISISVGPAVGGFIATRSYTIAFYFAATGLGLYGLLLTVFARETLQREPNTAIAIPKGNEILESYGRILKDGVYMSFILSFILTQMCAVLIWVLMGVYAKENYQIQENLYGFIPMTNALMVVFFQYGITQFTKRLPALQVMAVGSFLYGIGVGSVALAHGFWGFWMSMVIMTMGELIVAPTSSTFVANTAPADMRGRYMSLFALTWGTASGIAPLVGGNLSDRFGPVATWYGGFVAGLMGTLGFLMLWRYTRNRQVVQPALQPPQRSGS